MMKHTRIAVFVGSLRRESFNRKLANAIIKLAPAGLSFEPLEIGDLPLYNQDDDDNPNEAVKQLRAGVEAAQGFLFFTPEYNRSIPGVLKNAIDHASRPYGQRRLAGKPAAIMGASPGLMGTSMAQQHLRNVLANLDLATMGQPEAFILAKEGLFDKDSNLAEPGRAFFQDWIDRYAAWVASRVR